VCLHDALQYLQSYPLLKTLVCLHDALQDLQSYPLLKILVCLHDALQDLQSYPLLKNLNVVEGLCEVLRGIRFATPLYVRFWAIAAPKECHKSAVVCVSFLFPC
jgi:hypothetical protein